MNILLSSLDCDGVSLIIVRVLHLSHEVACEALFHARENTIRSMDKDPKDLKKFFKSSTRLT